MDAKFRIATLLVFVLGAISVTAGVIFVPVGNVYIEPDLATVVFRRSRSQAGPLQVDTRDLRGVLHLAARDVPDGFDAPDSGCARLPFVQDLRLVLARVEGFTSSDPLPPGFEVTGRSRGQIQADTNVPEVWDLEGRVRGDATCVASTGRRCTQWLMDLELRGALFETDEPSRAGLFRMQIVGSLVRRDDAAHWASLNANTTLGGSARLVRTIVDTVVPDDACPL